jgi:hypothetical protein
MSSKDFKKGIEAGAKPFEDKFKQHSEALTRVADKTETGIESVRGVMNAVIDDMTALEKKRLYDLNTQFDIKTLEDEEKELLLAVLFTLAKDDANENQQAFVRSVKKYLDIKNPQTDIDPAGIENIENLTAQKALFQTFAEFCFLEQENDAFLEERETLFDLFSIKKKDREAILGNIHAIHSATGAQGLCEKYGYVPAAAGNGLLEAPEPVALAKLVIEEPLEIAEGEEKRFEAQTIEMDADIALSGSLVFDHCVITYNGDDIAGHIALSDGGSLSFISCTIIGKNNKKPSGGGTFIKDDGEGRILIEKSVFLDCRNFMSVDESPVSIENCIFRFSKLRQRISLLYCGGEESKMSNCLIESLDDKGYDEEESSSDLMFGQVAMFGIGKVRYCTFRNIKGCFSRGLSSMNGCRFDNCVDIVGNTMSDIKLADSLFERCQRILSMSKYPEIKGCKFISCKNTLFGRGCSGSRFDISKCEFINYRAEEEKNSYGDMIVAPLAYIIAIEHSASMNFTKCVFDGVYLARKGLLLDVTVLNKRNQGSTSFDGCEFRHCKTEDGKALMDTTKVILGAFNKASTINIVTFQNCTGIDDNARLETQDKTGAIPEDQIVRLPEDGEPYGADEAELVNSGVPGAA